MKLVKGTNLSEQQRRNVLAAFPYRHTVERPDPARQQPPAYSDADFVQRYAFYMRNDGRLADRPNHCVPIALYDAFTGD